MDLGALSSSADVLHADRITPEADFLLASFGQRGAVAPDSLDWEALLFLVESHGLLPLFYQSCAGQLPEDFVRHFQRQWAGSLLLANQLEELLEEFAKRGIEVLPLKGPVLGETLHGHASLRPSDDLDLLVRPEEYSRAEDLLRELGFVAAGEVDNYHRKFERRGTFVELHFGMASPSAPDFDLTGAWARAQMTSFRGRSVRVLSPIDLILYLAHHGFKHRFARLVWVLDLARAVESLDDGAASSLLEEAAAQRLTNVLLVGCEIARQSFKIELPQKIADAIAARPNLTAHAAAVADGLLRNPADPSTSSHATEWYLQLESGRRPRWRQRFRLFLPAQRDYEWVARHGIHPVCAPVVRPFRVLFRHGPALAFRTLFPHR